MPQNTYEFALRKYAMKLILGQLLLVLFIVSITYLTAEPRSTKSAAVGGMMFLVPQYLFTRLSFLCVGLTNIAFKNALLAAGYICKFTLIMVLFLAIIPSKEIEHFNLFITFTAVMFSQIFSLLRPLPESFTIKSNDPS
jgi:ATP synthase protein I